MKPSKRTISATTIAAFLFTQCGIGMTAPVHPSNLRSEAIEHDNPRDPRSANLTGDLKELNPTPKRASISEQVNAQSGGYAGVAVANSNGEKLEEKINAASHEVKTVISGLRKHPNSGAAQAMKEFLQELSQESEEEIDKVFSDARFKSCADSTLTLMTRGASALILIEQIGILRNTFIMLVGGEDQKQELVRKREDTKCRDALESLCYLDPVEDIFDLRQAIIADLILLGVERYAPVKEELLRWYNQSGSPALKKIAWWVLYRIGENVELPETVGENGIVCSLDNFNPPQVKDVREVIYGDEKILEILTENPWLEPAYMVKVDATLVESGLPENMLSREEEILDKISYQVVSQDDAELLLKQSRKVILMFSTVTSAHGRQVFYVDNYGNWYGLKGVGRFPRKDKRNWSKPEDSRNMRSGLAEVDHEDAKDYISQLRDFSLKVKEAGIGNSEIVAGVRYNELWDAEKKEFVDVKEFNWHIPFVDERGRPEKDKDGNPQMVRFVPGVQMIYYGKEARRLREYANMGDTPLYCDFVRLSIAKKFGVNFPDGLTYAKWLAYRIGLNLAKLINLGYAHYYLNAHNIMVDGTIVDMESMQDLNEVSNKEALSLIKRDIRFTVGTVNELLASVKDIGVDQQVKIDHVRHILGHLEDTGFSSFIIYIYQGLWENLDESAKERINIAQNKKDEFYNCLRASVHHPSEEIIERYIYSWPDIGRIPELKQVEWHMESLYCPECNVRYPDLRKRLNERSAEIDAQRAADIAKMIENGKVEWVGRIEITESGIRVVRETGAQEHGSFCNILKVGSDGYVISDRSYKLIPEVGLCGGVPYSSIDEVEKAMSGWAEEQVRDYLNELSVGELAEAQAAGKSRLVVTDSIEFYSRACQLKRELQDVQIIPFKVPVKASREELDKILGELKMFYKPDEIYIYFINNDKADLVAGSVEAKVLKGNPRTAFEALKAV